MLSDDTGVRSCGFRRFPLRPDLVELLPPDIVETDLCLEFELKILSDGVRGRSDSLRLGEAPLPLPRPRPRPLPRPLPVLSLPPKEFSLSECSLIDEETGDWILRFPASDLFGLLIRDPYDSMLVTVLSISRSVDFSSFNFCVFFSFGFLGLEVVLVEVLSEPPFADF